jgi:hypothetical protein
MHPRKARVFCRRDRLRALRRFFAVLTLGVLVAGCLEPLIAEAHDGDATTGVGLTVASPGETGVPTEPAPPTHEIHLCHCTHAHGASTLPSAEVSVVVSMVEETSPRRLLMAPSSVTLDGPMRPPAAARG